VKENLEEELEGDLGAARCGLLNRPLDMGLAKVFKGGVAIPVFEQESLLNDLVQFFGGLRHSDPTGRRKGKKKKGESQRS